LKENQTMSALRIMQFSDAFAGTLAYIGPVGSMVATKNMVARSFLKDTAQSHARVDLAIFMFL
jgi:hypothetical protein